jgi:O-antigen/teichoic acid export membrane protein
MAASSHLVEHLLRRGRSAVFLQSAVFTGTSAGVSVIAAATTALLARHLSTSGFGSFSFCVSLLVFIAMFFEFGLFLPASRLIAQADHDTRRTLVGAAVALFVPIGVTYSLVIALLSPAIRPVFGIDLGDALLFAAPLACAYPLVQVALQLTQGAGRLHLYSLAYLASQLVFGLGLLVLLAFSGLSVSSVLAIRGAAFLTCFSVAIALLRPTFVHTWAHARLLISEARQYGLQMYVGRVLSVGTYNMDALMLAAFAGPRQVGFYALAGSVAVATGAPMLGMSSALFPRMARGRDLDLRWIAIAASFSAVVLVVAVVLAGPFIRLVFSERYTPAVALVAPLVLAQGIRSITSIYNAFLAAQARGRELRNAAVVLTGSNVLLNFALIPPFGALGAAWASVVALTLNLWAHHVGYRRYVRRHEATVQDA